MLDSTKKHTQRRNRKNKTKTLRVEKKRSTGAARGKKTFFSSLSLPLLRSCLFLFLDFLSFFLSLSLSTLSLSLSTQRPTGSRGEPPLLPPA